MKRMMMSTAVVVLVAAAGCEPRIPSELRPGFDEMIDLPFDICSEESSEPATLQMRNIGDNEVTIESVVFVAADDQPEGLASFDEPEIDNTTLLAEEQAFVQFSYRVPGGLAQKAVLVITSDAEVNPELKVPVVTQELVVDNKAEICGTP